MPLGKFRRNRQREANEASPTTAASSPLAEYHGGLLTTVMVRNIPTRYTSLGLVEVLKEHGFDKTFDFLYLPMDFRTRKNVGYAFVNFLDPDNVDRFISQFQGLQLKASTSQKTLEIVPSRRQGFMDNISVFGASELLVSSTHQPFFKPLVMVQGELVPLTDKLYDQLVCERSIPEINHPPQIKVE
jgi:hypothetical protein